MTPAHGKPRELDAKADLMKSDPKKPTTTTPTSKPGAQPAKPTTGTQKPGAKPQTGKK